MSSNLEFKGADAFMGMGKGIVLPFVKKYDGKTIKFEVSKQFESAGSKLDVELNTSIVPSSGKYFTYNYSRV